MDAANVSRSLTSEGRCNGEVPLKRWEGKADFGFGPNGGDSMFSECSDWERAQAERTQGILRKPLLDFASTHHLSLLCLCSHFMSRYLITQSSNVKYDPGHNFLNGEFSGPGTWRYAT